MSGRFKVRLRRREVDTDTFKLPETFGQREFSGEKLEKLLDEVVRLRRNKEIVDGLLRKRAEELREKVIKAVAQTPEQIEKIEKQAGGTGEQLKIVEEQQLPKLIGEEISTLPTTRTETQKQTVSPTTKGTTIKTTSMSTEKQIETTQPIPTTTQQTTTRTTTRKVIRTGAETSI